MSSRFCYAWISSQHLSAEHAGEAPVDLFNHQPDHKGWGVFGRLSFADDDTNPFESSVSVGVGGRGDIDGRPNDVFGIGYFHNDNFSDRFTEKVVGLEEHDEGIEAFYNIAITPAARLTVSVQHLDATLEDVDDATVVTGRFHLKFCAQLGSWHVNDTLCVLTGTRSAGQS